MLIQVWEVILVGRGSTELDSYEYDDFLAKNKRYRELRERNAERRNANNGIEGWHFGIGEKPVYTRNKEEFKKELAKRGLMLKDDVRRELK